MKVAPLLVLALLAPVACDKADATADKAVPSPSASASAPPAAPPPSTASALPAATASATPPIAPSAAAPTKDAVVSVFDPVKEPARTVKSIAGGSVALYLPEWAGSTWKIPQPDKALGKPKEETIPGFAGPTTPAHAFTWQVKDALKGQVHKVTVTNSAKGRATDTTFTLTIDLT